MKLLELLGNKVQELTQILKDEDVKDLRIRAKKDGFRYFDISFILYDTRKINIIVNLDCTKNHRVYQRDLEAIEKEFEEAFDKLKSYIRSVKRGELRKLKNEIDNRETELRALKIKYNEMNNYGEKLD